MKSKQNIIIFVLQIVVLLLLQTAIADEQLDFTGAKCLKSDNVSTTGTYHSNIISVLNNLTIQSTTSKFFHVSSGTGENLVNGLYLCRPDLSLDTCHSCINTTLGLLDIYCSNKKEAIIWFDECMIRYTNRTIYRSMQTKPWYWNWSVFNVSRPDIFPGILNKTLQGIITEASAPGNKDRFAFGNTTFTPFEGFYGMALCTPDITPPQCGKCLHTALSRIPSCCADGLAEWTDVLLPSCILRYNTAPFIFPDPSPASSPLPSSSPSALAPSPTSG